MVVHPFEPEHGGQGLPWAVAIAVAEMWNSANMGWALCPLLNVGAVELLEAHGSAAQKATYLGQMISGEWTGTMNLTEPQAGSDVGALRTRAVKEGGAYRIIGQKIFITYGDHDWTDQIVHMVLARTPDAPPGPKVAGRLTNAPPLSTVIACGGDRRRSTRLSVAATFTPVSDRSATSASNSRV